MCRELPAILRALALFFGDFDEAQPQSAEQQNLGMHDEIAFSPFSRLEVSYVILDHYKLDLRCCSYGRERFHFHQTEKCE
jgi:hypothetical protein